MIGLHSLKTWRPNPVMLPANAWIDISFYLSSIRRGKNNDEVRKHEGLVWDTENGFVGPPKLQPPLFIAVSNQISLLYHPTHTHTNWRLISYLYLHLQGGYDVLSWQQVSKGEQKREDGLPNKIQSKDQSSGSRSCQRWLDTWDLKSLFHSRTQFPHL